MKLEDVLPTKIEEMHHAYLLIGHPEEGMSVIREFLSSHSYSVEGNPDFYEALHDVFSIQESRNLKEKAYLSPIRDACRVIVMGIWSITEEAQNALLKIVEEPSYSVRLFFVFPRKDLLIPTLASRLYEIGSCAITNTSQDSQFFMSLQPAERISLVASIIDSKNESEIHSFLSQLERIYYEQGDEKACVEIWDAIKMMSSHTVSSKLILEGLALSLPTK